MDSRKASTWSKASNNIFDGFKSMVMNLEVPRLTSQRTLNQNIQRKMDLLSINALENALQVALEFEAKASEENVLSLHQLNQGSRSLVF